MARKNGTVPFSVLLGKNGTVPKPVVKQRKTSGFYASALQVLCERSGCTLCHVANIAEGITITVLAGK